MILDDDDDDDDDDGALGIKLGVIATDRGLEKVMAAACWVMGDQPNASCCEVTIAAMANIFACTIFALVGRRFCELWLSRVAML